MEQSTGTPGATRYMAAETGRILLEAMSMEEPFQLLSAIPGKLQELRIAGVRRESTTVRNAPSLPPRSLNSLR